MPKKPRFIINGIPFPDWLRLELEFGHGGPSPIETPQFEGIESFGG